MNNVNQYVNAMKGTGNPGLLKQELVRHYKYNKLKAEKLIKVAI